jgi:hypothetical protein
MEAWAVSPTTTTTVEVRSHGTISPEAESSEVGSPDEEISIRVL